MPSELPPEIPLNQKALSSFLWSVADLLCGDYKQADFCKVILPFTVLRRLDCVSAPTKRPRMRTIILTRPRLKRYLL